MMATFGDSGRMRTSAFATAVLLLTLPCTLPAEEPVPVTIKASVDWEAGALTADFAVDLVQAGLRLPSGRAEAERLLERWVPELVEPTVLGIIVDSRRTISDTLSDGTADPAAFRGFLERGRRLSAVMSRDLRFLEASYEWRLSDLSALYGSHSTAMPLTPMLTYTPTRAYSGIVVYIQGALPVRGEYLPGRLVPCLLPRVYDEDMTVILDRYHVDPSILRSRGSVAYAYALDDPIIEERAGGDPLRILASAAFGSFRTDAIIRRDDALKILGDPANRDLIRAGRVVFVIDRP